MPYTDTEIMSNQSGNTEVVNHPLFSSLLVKNKWYSVTKLDNKLCASVISKLK